MFGSLCLLFCSLSLISCCKERPFFQDAGPIVKTLSGSVVGTYIKVFDTDVAAFLGIPFAVPPLGERRFQKPEPVQPWEGILMANEKPKPCMQFTARNISASGWVPTSTPSEDCLYLNIWSPTNCCCDERKLPVLVWIYGGAFSSGSTDLSMYDGSTMASFGEAIVVSFNYRVGSFGFIATESDEAPGNAGMHDQVMAMEWIKNNIQAFGGDPGSITLFGESAGAISISLHLISPLSRGLFHKAIMQSGSAYGTPIIDDKPTTLSKAKMFAQLTGCANETSDSLDTVRCLKNKDALDLSKVEAIITDKFPTFFVPTYPDEFLPKSPKEAYESGDVAPVEVMAGVMKNEATIFLHYILPEIFPYDGKPNLDLETGKKVVQGLFQKAPQPVIDAVWNTYFQGISEGDSSAIVSAISDSFGDFVFNCPVMFLAEKVDTAYFYWITHRSMKNPTPEWVGATHFDDVPYVFGIPITNTEHFTPEDGRFSNDLIQKWTSFARNGNPLGQNQDSWPKFNNSNPVVYELNPRNSNSLLYPRREACEFWRAALAASA